MFILYSLAIDIKSKIKVLFNSLDLEHGRKFLR